MSANLFSPALADSLKAVDLDPTNPKTIHRLARIYTSLGRPREALNTYALIPGGASSKDTDTTKQMLQAIDAAECAIKDEKGSGQLALWNLDRADKFLGSTVTRPRKWLLLRAEAYLKIGTANALGEVQGISTSLMRDNPADADALVVRGRAFYQAGENDNAVKHFRQALAYDPDLTMAGKLLKVVQKLDKAKEEGNSAFKTGRFARAVELYTEALEVDSSNKSTNAKILQNRAVARMKLKQFNEAISDCDQAIRLDPTYIKARKMRAKAVGESGNWDQAVKDLKELAEQHPEEPGMAKEVKDAEMELRKSKRKDYYKILGIEKDAGENEIKKGYRKQALVLHPDKNPGDEAAAEKFKDVGEAYECLSDPQKRERYDSGADLVDPAEMFGGGMPGGMGGGMGGFGGMGGGMQIDPEMLFNMMGSMGGARAGHGGGGMPQFSFQTGGHPGGREGFPF
jgi:DnaJ homolog subfamily C member 7